MCLDLPAELSVSGRRHRVVIRNLSRFGAFVSGAGGLARGALVELAIALDGLPRVTTTGFVVHTITEDAAARLHTAPGAGIQFRGHEGRADGFAVAIARVLARAGYDTDALVQERHDKPTRPMEGPVLERLISSMTTPPYGEDRLVLSGWLVELGLAPLLSALAFVRRSGRLVLERGPAEVTIELYRGDIVAARSSFRGLSPREVVMMALDWTEGTFRLSAAEGTGRRGDCRLVVAQLLLEHANVHDAKRDVPPILRIRFRDPTTGTLPPPSR